MERNEIVKKVVLDIAKLMCSAAITAPKAKGIDALYVKIFLEEEKNKVADLMEKIGKKQNIPFFIRDAKNVKDSICVVFIGSKNIPREVPNCGFCGYANCEEMKKNSGTCIYTACDLGIAMGSAVSIAGFHFVDNRIMFSFGKAAIEGKFVPENIKIGFGIPLSISGKNIFFDRKFFKK